MADKEMCIKLCNEKHNSVLVSGLTKLWKDNKLCDIRVVVDDKDFNCHSCVLVSCSGYFEQEIFKDGKRCNIDLSGVCSSNTFEHILEFIYTSQVQVPISQFVDFLKESVIFDISTLMPAINESFTPDLVTDDNVFSLIHIEPFKEHCIAYICDNFMDIITRKDFLEITFDTLRNVLIRDELMLENEEDALNAVICWTENSPADRIKKLVPLLKSLRLGLLKPSSISKLMRNQLFKLDNDAFNFAADLVKYSLSEENVHLDFEVCKKPRFKLKSPKIVIVGGYYYQDLPSRCVQAFDIADKTWSSLSDLPIAIIQPCTAVIENCMYVVGGNDNNYGELASTYCYNTSANEWCRKADMQTPRVGHSLVAIGEKLIAIGGCTSGDSIDNDIDQTKSVEAFDSVENKWSALSELPQPLSEGTACASHNGNYVHYFGGASGNTYLEQIHVYNVFTDTWTKINSTTCIINFRNILSTQLGERIFIFNEESPSVSEFFPDQKNTVGRKPNPTSRWPISVCSYKNEIFVLEGGYYQASKIDSYNIDKDEWVTVAELEENRYSSDFGACILKF